MKTPEPFPALRQVEAWGSLVVPVPPSCMHSMHQQCATLSAISTPPPNSKLAVPYLGTHLLHHQGSYSHPPGLQEP